MAPASPAPAHRTRRPPHVSLPEWCDVAPSTRSPPTGSKSTIRLRPSNTFTRDGTRKIIYRSIPTSGPCPSSFSSPPATEVLLQNHRGVYLSPARASRPPRRCTAVAGPCSTTCGAAGSLPPPPPSPPRRPPPACHTRIQNAQQTHTASWLRVDKHCVLLWLAGSGSRMWPLPDALAAHHEPAVLPAPPREHRTKPSDPQHNSTRACSGACLTTCRAGFCGWCSSMTCHWRRSGSQPSTAAHAPTTKTCTTHPTATRARRLNRGAHSA